MPNIGGKKFPYTAAGMRAARSYKKNLSKGAPKAKRGNPRGAMGSPRAAGSMARPGTPMRRKPARPSRPARPIKRRRGGY